MIFSRRIFLMLFLFVLPLLSAPGLSVAHELVMAHTQGKGGVVLPAMLHESDADLYRTIFQVQEEGKWKTADKLIARLKDKMLLGHVMAQRYLHPTKYRSSFSELKGWMAKYADLPDARQMYKLAKKRQRKGWRVPKRPVPVSGPGFYTPRETTQPRAPRKRLTRSQRRKVAAWKRQIRSQLRKGYTKAVKNLLMSKGAKTLFSTVEYDQASAKLAARYFTDGRDAWAVKWAGKAAARSGDFVPEAGWTAGLASWRQGKHAEAGVYFETVALSPSSSSWLVSAGAFWAARSYLVGRQPTKVTQLLSVAAEYPRTFYGLLASRLLGRSMPFDWTSPDIHHATLEELTKTHRGRRSLALLQVGENRRAERELKNLSIIAGSKLAEGIMMIASQAGMPSLSLRLVEGMYPNGGVYDSAAYPVPEWEPKEGFRIDRALIYAMIRQESRFNPKAKSRVGARGLMQLMPGTASFVARDRRFRWSKLRTLYKPGVNLALGQKYIEMLLRDDKINGNMFLMAAAWNGGPGNLSKWRREVDHMDDALFFIETLPSRETRVFIERVFANLWIYRHRLNQSAPSLDAIAAGKWPVYIGQDDGSQQVAENGENSRRTGIHPR